MTIKVGYLIGFLLGLVIVLFIEVANGQEMYIYKPIIQQQFTNLGIKKKVVITSYSRTAERQARILTTMWDLNKRPEHMYLDKRLLAQLEDGYKHAHYFGVLTILKKQIWEGRYISKHLCGKAMDIRTVYLTKRQKRAVVDILKKLWYNKIKVVSEVNHLHLELKEDC